MDKEGTLDEMWRKYNEDEEEDELYFIEEVFQKYYHYSKDENALKYVKPKTKFGGLIWFKYRKSSTIKLNPTLINLIDELPSCPTIK